MWDPQQPNNAYRRYGDSLTFLYVDGDRTSQETRLWVSTAYYGDSFTFLYVDDVPTSHETRYGPPRSVTGIALILLLISFRIIYCVLISSYISYSTAFSPDPISLYLFIPSPFHFLRCPHISFFFLSVSLLVALMHASNTLFSYAWRFVKHT
jgi:hypothetical protein